MSESLHICFVTDAFPPSIGGVQFHTYQLVNHIAKLGHKVTVITHNLPNAKETEIIEGNIEVRRLKGKVLYFGGHDEAIDFRMINQFREILKEKDFNVVYGQSFLSFLVFGCLYEARRKGIPTIITKCSIIEQHRKTRLFARAYLHLLVPLLNKFDAIKVVTEGSRSELPLHKIRIPVYLIPHGVDTLKWTPDNGLRELARKKLGYESEDIVIGYLGRFVARKGILLLLKIAPFLVKDNRRVKFLLVGDGPLKPVVMEKIKKMGLEEHFILLGYKPHDETPFFYNAMDIFAFPTYGEAFGLVLVEAMACGVCPVTMDNWGTRDIVTDGVDGFLAKTLDEFKEKLILLRDNSELRKKLSENGRNKMISKFSWEVSAKKTIDICRNLSSTKSHLSVNR